MTFFDQLPIEADDKLYECLVALPRGQRSLVAIAGAPGVGKTALADSLTVRLNQHLTGRAVAFAVDGFLLDDMILRAIGSEARKGAPDTFDVGGLTHTLKRLKSNDEANVAIPVYDPLIEAARANARLISNSVEIVIVEGAYLLGGAMPWTPLAGHFDFTAMVEVSQQDLRARLKACHRDEGLDEKEADARIEGLDLPNADYVKKTSTDADLVVHLSA